MPVAISYPGVYIEEVSSGVHTIMGVATSIAAFVDYFPKGPINRAVRVQSAADFERNFGGLDQLSESSYAIQQFFLNGGSEACVVRVTSTTQANAAKAAAITMKEDSGGAKLLTATANNPGAGGNDIRLDVDYGTNEPDHQFNLTVTQVASSNGNTQVVAIEKFRNLVIDSNQPNDAVAVVNAGSQLVTLKALTGSTGHRPAQTGTASAALTALPAVAVGDTLTVALGGTSGTTAALTAVPATLPALAATLEALIRGIKSGSQALFPNATVTVFGSLATKAYLIVEAGTDNAADFLVLSGGMIGTAKLDFPAAAQNVQQYALGAGAVQAAADAIAGTDGIWDLSDAGGIAGGLIGDPATKTGMHALLDVDLFNILCIPATMILPDTNAVAVAAAAIQLCTERRAMYVVDVPQGAADTIDGVKTWLDAHASLRSRNAAVYFPRVDIADPLSNFRLRVVAASGTIAGLYARTDAARGVWKAPAGTDAGLRGVQKLQYKLTDPENGVLNPLAINCLRVFPVYGPVCWGARTLMGADQQADDYKYIPVRRLALFIEESLFRGTQWVVFEPNDEPLWSQIRLNLGAFMHDLFRKGAFQGKTPTEAYFVKCDKDTTTQNDINLGIVNITVGFAPLKPAEFVVIKIQQIAGGIAS